MTFPGRIIRSFKENKVAGLCFGFGNVLALVPQTVGGGAPHIVAVLVVDPANVAGAIKPGFRAVAAAGLRGCASTPLTADAARRALSLADAAIQRLAAQVNPKITLSVLAAKLG